ncbi:MAG: hypothetical protein BWY93_02114 [Euryarchaeota archaeon ADurb.BinA087]|nr:MAG: hypothetical protein BWY93_02114 [Euryarchaeota archaeon ADurb.BinA087]
MDRELPCAAHAPGEDVVRDTEGGNPPKRYCTSIPFPMLFSDLPGLASPLFIPDNGCPSSGTGRGWALYPAAPCILLPVIQRSRSMSPYPMVARRMIVAPDGTFRT